MRFALSLVFCIIGSAVAACPGQSQLEMNNCAAADFQNGIGMHKFYCKYFQDVAAILFSCRRVGFVMHSIGKSPEKMN